jgi:hypothetical protein
MPRQVSGPEGIIAKLREADFLLGQGKRVAEAVRALGIGEVNTMSRCVTHWTGVPQPAPPACTQRARP